jgi:bifunctional DNase/RNase
MPVRADHHGWHGKPPECLGAALWCSRLGRPASCGDAVVTTVRIAYTEPWPGKRVAGRGFGFFSMLVVLADDSGGWALPVWLNGSEGHGLFRGRDDDHSYPEAAEVITADLLRAAGVTVSGVDIDELDTALTTGPRPGCEAAQATARIEFTAAGTAEPRQMPVRIGYALAMAAATGAPVQVADQLMDQLAVPAQGDLVGQFTRDVPLPRPPRGLSRLVRGSKLIRQPTR